MKKIILNLVKKVEQKNKRQFINDLLTVEMTIPESIELFEKIKADFLFNMNKEEQRLNIEKSMIQRLKPANEYDPNFDKPLSEIETNYQIVTHE